MNRQKQAWLKTSDNVGQKEIKRNSQYHSIKNKKEREL